MPADTTELRSIRNENKNSEKLKNPFKENDGILNFFGKTIRPNHTRYLKELLSGNQNQRAFPRSSTIQMPIIRQSSKFYPNST